MRLARDHSFRPRSAGNGRRRENRQVGVATRESIEAVLAISYGCEFSVGGPVGYHAPTSGRRRRRCRRARQA